MNTKQKHFNSKDIILGKNNKLDLIKELLPEYKI